MKEFLEKIQIEKSRKLVVLKPVEEPKKVDKIEPRKKASV